MKKTAIIIIVFLLIVLALFFLSFNRSEIPENVSEPKNLNPKSSSDLAKLKNLENFMQNNFFSPLSRSDKRITKKPFGILITPQTSPIQPEKFYGYHTGTDFEIFPEELNAEVALRSVCSGKLLFKKYINGYGGAAVELCKLDNQPITVIYGHLKLSSITTNTGDDINAGDTLGILGKAYSNETDGERKHLHLGFHKGTDINILGYVKNKTDLSGWIDPCLYVCK